MLIILRAKWDKTRREFQSEVLQSTCELLNETNLK